MFTRIIALLREGKITRLRWRTRIVALFRSPGVVARVRPTSSPGQVQVFHAYFAGAVRCGREEGRREKAEPHGWCRAARFAGAAASFVPRAASTPRAAQLFILLPSPRDGQSCERADSKQTPSRPGASTMRPRAGRYAMRRWCNEKPEIAVTGCSPR